MSNLSEAYEAFSKAVNDVNHGGKTPDYTVISARYVSVEALKGIAEHLAVYFANSPADSYLYEDEEDDDFNPLSIDVYKNVRDESQGIVDALLTYGGPDIRARYESADDCLTVSINWCGPRLTVRTRDENLKLYRDMRSIAEANGLEC